ncbi:MAG TPA: alkaline phosphatase family protein, partial [Cytophagaceae bacterium]|nr:alkaline phosphatase family protein [Cytophagaceae bacterium]
MGKRLAKKVLLIGWDAADWKVINPLLEAGEMPTLKKFLAEGVYGNIATMDPPLSPMLWTSIATGKTPDQHGILNFTEPDSVNGGIKPVTSTSRKVKAIWNILNQNGMKSNVISWWPSNPAEPINGVMVSNLFQKAKGEVNQLKPMASGSVHPKRLEDIIAECRIHPNELTEQHIVPFIPEPWKIDQEKDKGLVALSTILAETSSVHAAATWVMENEEWDFMAVYYDGIDHFCHAFMKYYPPKISSELSDELFNLYKDVVKGGYKFHDMMLERLLQLAGEDTTVIIMSDHGFHSDHLRPLVLPNEPAAPAFEHRDYGVFCMKGPHVKHDYKIFGTSLLDIAPTLLTLFGLPVGKDMLGKPLLDAFDTEVKPDFISSWEEIAGESGMHGEELQQDPVQAMEALQQLVDLGYIDDPGKDKNQASKDCVRDSQYNLGKSLLSFLRYEEALPVFQKLSEENLQEIRFTIRYLLCLEKLNKLNLCREII